tara:strand:- start:230 stop:505 length:276 start_codon:yes stop_codon:yes gene_type:complete
MALSKTQQKRLGSILGFMFNQEMPSDIVNELIQDGYVEVKGNGFKLTPKGLDEKNRLTTLAGLSINYKSEKKGPDNIGKPALKNETKELAK